MSEHVIEWLNAYHDGELRGGKLQRVQEHLADRTHSRTRAPRELLRRRDLCEPYHLLLHAFHVADEIGNQRRRLSRDVVHRGRRDEQRRGE